MTAAPSVNADIDPIASRGSLAVTSSTLLTVLSLVLCVANAFIWIRAAAKTELVTAQPAVDGVIYFAMSAHSDLVVGQIFPWGDHNPRFRYDDTVRDITQDIPTMFNARFLWAVRYSKTSFAQLGVQHPKFANRNFLIVAIPYWLICCFSGALPATQVGRRIHRKFKPPPAGLCCHCGYDLRATPERCPECGTAASSELVGRTCK